MRHEVAPRRRGAAGRSRGGSARAAGRARAAAASLIRASSAATSSLPRARSASSSPGSCFSFASISAICRRLLPSSRPPRTRSFLDLGAAVGEVLRERAGGRNRRAAPASIAKLTILPDERPGARVVRLALRRVRRRWRCRARAAGAAAAPMPGVGRRGLGGRVVCGLRADRRGPRERRDSAERQPRRRGPHACDMFHKQRE